jgi:hypothetical protein
MIAKTKKGKAIDAEKESRAEVKRVLSDPDTKDVLEKMFVCGLKLKLEAARRNLPHFKGSRKPEHMKLSRGYRRAAERFAGVIVKGYFIVQGSGQSLN